MRSSKLENNAKKLTTKKIKNKKIGLTWWNWSVILPCNPELVPLNHHMIKSKVHFLNGRQFAIFFFFQSVLETHASSLPSTEPHEKYQRATENLTCRWGATTDENAAYVFRFLGSYLYLYIWLYDAHLKLFIYLHYSNII